MCLNRICCGRNSRSVSLSVGLHMRNENQFQLSTKISQFFLYSIFFTGLKPLFQTTGLFHISGKLLSHREFESFPLTFEILMLIMHRYNIKIFDHSLMAMTSNLSAYSYMWISARGKLVSGPWELHGLHLGDLGMVCATEAGVYSDEDSNLSGKSMSSQDFLHNAA